MIEPTNDTEQQVRTLMNIAVGEPPRRLTAEAVRRGAVRRRMMGSVAAATAVVLVAGVAVAFAAQLGARRQQPPGPTHPPLAPVSAGVPRYYVVGSKTWPGDVTQVRATATGAVRAEVQCPWPVANIGPSPVADIRPWPVAPAANQTFLLVCQQASSPAQTATIRESRIYQFRVTSAGRISGYRLVRGGSLPGLRVRNIAVTPDGSEIAVTVYPGSIFNLSPKIPDDLVVINTRTGAHAIWHAAPPVPGKIVYWPQAIWPQVLSLTADGRELAFLTQPQCFGSHCHIRDAGQQIRVVSPAASGGQLNNSRVLVRLSSLLQPSTVTVVASVLSPDGSTLTLEIVGNLSHSPVSVVQLPATGHGRLRFIYRLAADASNYSYSFFSADPSARHFLIGAGGQNGIVAGRIVHGRLIPLKPAGWEVAFEVW